MALSIPMDTGMVKVTVTPKREEQTIPPSNAPSGSRASRSARGAPPMSQAKSAPANMAGSTPIKSNSGRITGERRSAKRGASTIMPVMVKARGPMVVMPRSKALPRPKRLEMI